MMNKMGEEHQLTDRASSQLIQAEKLASIGHLAAGVAHEINNPLGFIDSNLGTLQQYIDHLTQLYQAQDQFQEAIQADNAEKAAQAKAKVAEIKAAKDTQFILTDIGELIQESRQGVERIKRIVASLKMFTKVQEEKKTLFDIKDILENVLSLTENETKYKTKVKLETGDLPQIECFPQQLGHVFINLILNAVEAIPKEGDVSIKAQVKSLAEGDAGVGRRKNDPFRPGDKALAIVVADNGKGIAKDIQTKVFDPFFTTKDVNEGPGLGLTLSYDIIKKHSGIIDLKSTEGKGTTVTILLPLT